MENIKCFTVQGVILLCLVMITVEACHTMKFEIENTQHEKIVEDTNWFFLAGLFPTREIDVSLKCPRGVSFIREQTTFGDGVIDFISFKIVSPRSVWYYCLAENNKEQRPTALPVEGGQK